MILFSAVDNGSCLQGGCIYGEGGHLTGFCQPFVSQRGHSFCGCGQFFQLVGERADILKENAQQVEKFPLVKTLLIPGESLPVARLKVKEPGTAHYANYQKLSKELLEAAQEQVMPEYLEYQKQEAMKNG